REKWRLALDMIDQMRGGWQLPDRPVVADSGYGDCTLFRLGLAERGLSYVVQGDPDATAQPGDAIPAPPGHTGPGPPPQPGPPHPAGDVQTAHPGRRTRQRAAGHLAARHPRQRHQPRRRDALALPRDAYSSGQPRHPPRRRRQPAAAVADRRMATGPARTGQVLAVQPEPAHPAEDPGPPGEDPLAGRTRPPRTQKPPPHRPPP